jgi:ATP-dependent DNA helicase RecG
LPAAETTTRLPIAFGGGLAEEPPRPRAFPVPEELERTLDELPGVGSTLRRQLSKLGLRTVADLLRHAPFRYESAVDEKRIAALRIDEEAVVSVEVVRFSSRRARRRMTIQNAVVTDGDARLGAVWFNQPWLEKQLPPGRRVRLRGRLQRRGEFLVKSFDLGERSATANYAPVYPASEDVTPKKLRELVAAALPQTMLDPLPADLRAGLRFPSRADAHWALHRPRSLEQAECGRRRLAFDELLLLQLAIARRRRERDSDVAPALPPPGPLLETYRRSLPFTLTEHQERVIAEIDGDLQRTAPMQRLLQGDVGSGKTVVALYALLRAVETGRQGVLMAPTETLAEQHFFTLERVCAEIGVTCALLTNATRKRERAQAQSADIVVGTHALIQEGVELHDLAVAVVDEQHRFGVAQRQVLSRARGDVERGRTPHVLHMTATPIPRTLALTVYGDLAVSEIAKPPANRKPIVTAWVSQERSADAYTRLRRHLDAGRQAYVVCPLIEESETTQARAAEAEAERLRYGELRGYAVGLLHGRLKPAERRELMARFTGGELDVLVATTVIEVGVDVPNATIMIVQEADRFGLAQLHQLRGRVGRGADQSYCLLVSRPRDELTESAVARLEALVRTTDGFELAEVDLDLRGGGQLLGTRQSGLTDLHFAHIRRDRELLEAARAVAADLVDSAGPLDDEVERRFSALDAAALA